MFVFCLKKKQIFFQIKHLINADLDFEKKKKSTYWFSQHVSLWVRVVLHFYSPRYCRCESAYARNVCEQRVVIASSALFLRGLALPFTLH